MFAGGYTISTWDAETWQNKARALAHLMEHNIREAYTAEQAMDEADKSSGKKKGLRDYVKEAGFEAFRQG